MSINRHRTVADVMSHHVVRARPDTTFKELAELLARNDVSAVPVIDGRGCPIGIVSEADLLRKEAARADPEGHLPPFRMTARQRTRAEADTARAIRTSPVFTARPEWNLVQATRALVQHGVKRLVVIDEVGRMIGIVSRSDLLRVFLRTDTAIREEVVHDVLAETLLVSRSEVAVQVHEGVVTLRGKVEQRSLIPVIVRLVRGVDGVVNVREALDFRVDDIPAAELRRA